VLDLLEWLARRERSYHETMDAWRTSCPRLPVWEDATDHGLISIEQANGHPVVRVTPAGFAFLHESGRGGMM
jgi:D-3-phosphoglycerate dehydrogenase